MARNDFLPFDADEYRAVVNPTNLVQQTWGYGRRLVLVPGELKDPRRAPVQFVKARIARKAVKNRRRFLQLMTVEQGMRLINLAQKLDNFPEAYRQLTGRTGTTAGEIMMEREIRNKLRRVLIHQVGIPEDAMGNWTISDMRAVIKDNTLLSDVDDVTGRPRIDAVTKEQGSVFDAMSRAQDTSKGAALDTFTAGLFHESEPARPSSEDRVGEQGLAGDFFIPEEIGDEPTVEEQAARATAEFDVSSGGAVAGAVPATVAASEYFKGITVTTEGQEIDPKDLQDRRSFFG